MDKAEVIISGVGIDLTDSLKNIVQEKVSKLIRHDSRIIRIRVSLGVSKNKEHKGEYIATGMIEIGGPDITARAETDDLYKSIDELVDKLNRQLVDNLKKANLKSGESIRVSA